MFITKTTKNKLWSLDRENVVWVEAVRVQDEERSTEDDSKRARKKRQRGNCVAGSRSCCFLWQLHPSASVVWPCAGDNEHARVEHHGKSLFRLPSQHHGKSPFRLPRQRQAFSLERTGALSDAISLTTGAQFWVLSLRFYRPGLIMDQPVNCAL